MEVREERGDRGNGTVEKVVKWDKYLPKMVIRVLLVEADYSTRQIIASLLRKCNYQVAAIPDGLKAWEILKRRHNSIDLVLTELDLPSISGYALLTLIMEHESCKNIPVIMMSQHDSISMVLKCLLKGASDFLIKPVRTNELKNLWQHVWKRLPSNNGHVSDDMVRNNGEDTLENNEVSNLPGDNVSSSPRDHALSGKASDAQSSCTTRYGEAECVCMENMHGVSQLKHGNVSETSQAKMEPYKKKLRLDKDLTAPEDGVRENSTDVALTRSTPFHERCTSKGIRIDNSKVCDGRMMTDDINGKQIHQDAVDVTCYQLPEPHCGAIDFLGRLDDQQRCGLLQCRSNNEGNLCDVVHQLELSLALQTSQNQVRDANVGHSNASAFSRYGDSKEFHTLFPSAPVNGTVLKGEKSLNGQRVTSEDAVDTSLLLRNSLVGMEENNVHAASSPSVHRAMISNIQLGIVHCPGDGTKFPGMLNPQSRLPSNPKSGDQFDEVTDQCAAGGEVYKNKNVESMDPEHDADNLPVVINRASSARSSNRFAEDASSNSTCGSALGETDSQHATSCNGYAKHDGSYSNARGRTPGATDSHSVPAVIAGSGKIDEDLMDDRANVVMENHLGVIRSCHSAQREAALVKFRQKRKDRCYEKKVRYQSRKILAEQRPRVKGQFVRQVQIDQ